MMIHEISDAQARIRRDAILALAENRYVDEPYNDEVLAALLPDSEPAHWVPLWEELCERIDWRDQVEAGADLGCDDDGRPEDRDTVLADVENDIAALLTKMVTHPAPAVMLRRAA